MALRYGPGERYGPRDLLGRVVRFRAELRGGSAQAPAREAGVLAPAGAIVVSGQLAGGGYARSRLAQFALALVGEDDREMGIEHAYKSRDRTPG